MKKFLSYLNETLEIDEVSYKGLSNYRKAAKDDIKNIDKEAKKIPYRGFTEKQLKQHDSLMDKKLNRIKGIDKAYKKMRGKNPGQYPIDELSSETLGSYIKKASDARGHRGLPAKKVDNRYSGVYKASKRLDKMDG